MKLSEMVADVYEFKFINQFNSDRPNGVVAFDGEVAAKSVEQATNLAIRRWAQHIERNEKSHKKVLSRMTLIKQSINNKVVVMQIALKKSIADEYTKQNSRSGEPD